MTGARRMRSTRITAVDVVLLSVVLPNLGCIAVAEPSQKNSGASASARVDSGGDVSRSPSAWSAHFLGEWLLKQEEGLPRHEDSLLHFVYDEWFATGHVRVSVRGNGAYVIEIDGIDGWRSFTRKTKDPVSIQRQSGNFTGVAEFPFLDHFVQSSPTPSAWRAAHSYFEYPPCTQVPSGTPSVDPSFGASMTLLAESGDPRLAVFRSEWRSPHCPGFPHELAKEAWKLVEKVTKKTVVTPAWHGDSPSKTGEGAHKRIEAGF